MSFLTSIVIYTPFWNQEYPPILLGGHSGDSNENVLFQCTYRSEILHKTSLIFIYVILTTKVIKTPIRYQEFPPRLLEGSSGFSQENEPRVLTFSTELPNVYPYHYLCPKSSRFYSAIKNVLQVFLVDIPGDSCSKESGSVFGKHLKS